MAIAAVKHESRPSPSNKADVNAGRSAKSNVVIGTIAVLVLCCAAYVSFRPNRLPASVEDAQGAHGAIGRRAADEVRRLLGGRGTVVAISIDPKLAPTGEMQLRPFSEAIGREASLTLTATEILGAPVAAYGIPAPFPGRGLPADDFERLLEKHRAADAVVSFVGLPLLTPEQIQRLGSVKRPKLVITLLGFDREDVAAQLRQLFAAKLVDVAIVPRAAPATGKDTNPFDRHYEVITPLSVSRL